MSTTETTREQRFAAQIEQLRKQYPTLDESHWEKAWETRRLQWQVEDLGNGIAGLVGKYGYHVEQDPTNTRLAALVAELAALSDQPAPAQGVERWSERREVV